MANERAVRCGTASGAALPATKREQLGLRIWGPHPNVFVRVEDVREALWAEAPTPFLDLLDVAAYVYAADQAIPRGGDVDRDFGADWRRRLHFAIPVRDPGRWSDRPVQEALAETLSFLSEDEYHFYFEPLERPPERQRYLDFTEDRFGGAVEEVVLFSGGLDSLGGAVQEAVLDGRKVVLVQHRSNPKVAPVVRRLVRELAAQALRAPPVFLPVRVNKDRGLSREPTQRTRSFLFAALGATFAAMLKLSRLRFYENGVTSLNLPPSAQVVGARASRTTHPRVLDGLGRLFSRLAGRRFTVENPFQWRTKAEVVRLVAGADCGPLIGHTRSCARPRQAENDRPHCGVCSQCIDRRIAVLAAGQGDNDPAGSYRVELFTGPRSAGPPQTMLAIYAEMARQVGRMTAPQFFARFGEASRALHHSEGGPEVAAKQVFDLYCRHARDVNKAVEDALAGHITQIRERTLPASCLLRMVFDPGELEAAQQPPPPAPREEPPASNVFRRKGEAWEVRFGGGSDFFLLPSRGRRTSIFCYGNPAGR
jgi:hypothetical protein